MGNNTSTSSHASTFSRGQGTSSNIRDALPSLPGSQPKNKTGRKVTAQKMKTARATGVLALQEHGLKEVPEELFQLVNLRTLNLASSSLKILPTAIGTLTKLKTMRLDSNKLEALPDLSALLALTDLSAGGNSLRGAEALGSLPPSLSKLSLRDNRLGEVPFAVLSGLPALQVAVASMEEVSAELERGGKNCTVGAHDMNERSSRSQKPVSTVLATPGDEYFDDTHSFNLDKSAWAVLVTTGDRPSPRYKHQVFIDGDSMYVVGGGSFEPEGPHLDVYRLHLAGARALEWERIRPIGEPPRCLAAHGLAWDRVGRAAYIWGGFTSGMELDCTFHALRLPLPSSIPETTASSDAGASSTPILASRNRASIPSGLGAAASDGSSAYDDADADAVLADIITSETAENASGAARSLDSTASLAVLGAGIGEGLEGATSGTTETAEQRQHQVQQGHQPLAQWDYELRPARVPGRDFWRRRGPCLWRQGTRDEAGASGPTVTYRRPRDDRGRMGSWGQGWTTDRLQGLWGGGSPPSSSASPSPADAHADADTDSVEVVDVASTFVHDSGASVMLWTNCSAAQRALRASKAAVDEDLVRWVSLPSRSSLGSDTDSSPSPAGRSFHCVVFHGGSVYVTGGSDGDRKFGDMWRFSASESPPPLTTLAARALVSNLAAVGDGSGGRLNFLMELPEGVPTELREALANLNMQAKVVL